MFHSRKINNNINRLHERCLRIVYNDNIQSNFKQLPEKDNSVSIHERNLQALAIEMFKVYKEQGPEILVDVFPLNSQPVYQMRNHSYFATRPIRTVHYGENSLRYLGQKFWELIPSHIKGAKTVEIFKNRIKTWVPENCPCRLISMCFLCVLFHFFSFL